MPQRAPRRCAARALRPARRLSNTIIKSRRQGHIGIDRSEHTRDDVIIGCAGAVVCPPRHRALYLYSGIGKVMAFSATAGRLNGWADGFGSALAAGAIAVELGGGVALLLGLFARQAALALIPFTIAATLMFHNFWAAPEAQVMQQTINFLKNLGLIGALALLAHRGAGKYALGS
jgi:putative oxidoreductase